MSVIELSWAAKKRCFSDYCSIICIYWSAGTSLTIFADVFLYHPFWRNAGTKDFESHCGIFLHSSTKVLKGNYIIFVKIKFLFRHLDQVTDPLVSLLLEPGAEETVFLHQKG